MNGSSLSPQALAQMIWRAHQSREKFESVRQQAQSGDLDMAYRIQDEYVALLRGSEGEPRGYKIGLTTPRMQQMCGIDEPVAGRLLSNRVLKSGCSLNADSFVRLGIECELCVVMAKDLPGRSEGYSLEEISAVVGGVCAAFEIIDDRHSDYSVLDAFSLIADNSWNAAVVLAEPGMPGNMAALQGTLRINGEVADVGSSADALSHPLAVVQWLSGHLFRRGASLAAGDLIMTGSIVPTRFAEPGEHYHFELEQLSPVSLTVR
jgi:2-keto-4-pentenoate hydratase